MYNKLVLEDAYKSTGACGSHARRRLSPCARMDERERPNVLKWCQDNMRVEYIQVGYLNELHVSYM